MARSETTTGPRTGAGEVQPPSPAAASCWGCRCRSSSRSHRRCPLIAAFYAGGGILLAYSAPILMLAAVIAWVRIGGRPLVEWVLVGAWWLWRTTAAPALYRRRIVAPRPASTPASRGHGEAA